MRRAKISVHGLPAGELLELSKGNGYEFAYFEGYDGAPVSLTMPTAQRRYSFAAFPPFFEGLLPEGMMLEGMLQRLKLERDDHFSQIMALGGDLVGAVTVEPMPT